MNNLSYEEIDYIIETLTNKALTIQFVLDSELFKKVDTTKLEKALELTNSSVEKLQKEKGRILNEED